MAYREHTALSSFFWDSRLSNERKQEIIDWVAGLPDHDALKLQDLIDDVREEAHFNAAESECI